MKHKTIVRLVVKLFGLYLLVQGLPSALSQVANLFMNSTVFGSAVSSGFGPNNDWRWMIPSFLYWGVQITVGAYLLFAGRFVINLIVPSNHAYCPECGYELRQPIPANCSECGTVLPHNVTRQPSPPPQQSAAPPDRAEQ